MKRGIDAQRWPEVRALFDELADLDAATQRARLDSLRPTDPELIVAVEQLLLADAQEDSPLTRLESALVAVGVDAIVAETPADPLRLTGQTVSHFQIMEPLAAGGMGVVYRAQDLQLRRPVALKFPLPQQHLDRRAKGRFLQEARSAGALDHPNLCSIYEAGETSDGQLFLAMPLYEGETLKARLARAGALPVNEAVTVALQIARGLSAAHKAAIVHRDLKPGNVMLLPDGTVKILDFGLAKVADHSLTTSALRTGTVFYMAPEQIRGLNVDSRADLWALGVVLYELLTARRPFEGTEDVGIAHAIVHEPVVPPVALRSVIPSELNALVLKLLEKNPEQRIASAEEVAARLAALQLRPADAPPAPADHELRVFPRSRRRVLPALIAIALFAGAVAFVAWRLRQLPAAAPVLVAVFPFDNHAGGAHAYLANGLRNQIASDLSQIARVHVVSRPIAQTVRMRASLRTGDSTLLLDARLIHADSATIWSRQYTIDAANVLPTEQALVRDVTRALRVRMSKAERALLDQESTTNAEAYDAYLHGRAAEPFERPAPRIPLDDLRIAQSYYWRARQLDPNFALARGRLALTHVVIANFHEANDARREQARIEATAALSLLPNLPEAHNALAHYWSARGHSTNAIAEWSRVIAVKPNSAEAHNVTAIIHRRAGRWEDAIAEFEKAMRADPAEPDYGREAAFTLSRVRRYSDAVRVWDQVLAQEPHDYLGWIIKGAVFLRWQGTADTLMAVVRRIPVEWDKNGMRTYTYVDALRLQRKYNEALQVLAGPGQEIGGDELFYRPRTLLRAQIYERLGETERARQQYQAALALLQDSAAAHPNDARIRIALGLANAGLGRNDLAMREAARAMELVPLSQSAIASTAHVGGAAEIFARVGEPGRALELLELLLAMPAGREVSVPLLRADPTWDSLRQDPRFDRMLARFSIN